MCDAGNPFRKAVLCHSPAPLRSPSPLHPHTPTPLLTPPALPPPPSHTHSAGRKLREVAPD